MTELRAAELRFTSAEAAEFLNQVMGPDLSARDIAALETRTEGRIAGLQLAAISMRGQEDVSGFIESFTGSHHFVLDYLVAEVLQQQPESVQTFLLQTSILDRLTGSLCDAVRLGFSGSPTGQEDGQAALEQLAHANLGFDLTAEAGRLDHRVLVLFGEDDPSGVPLVEETLAALRSADTEFALLKRCGHFWHECPDQFYPPVRAFLALVGSQEREITQ